MRLKELATIRERMEAYAALPGDERSGEAAKHLVEDLIRVFLGDGLNVLARPGGRRPRQGARRRAELDVTVCLLEEERPLVGTSHSGAYDESRSGPLRGHIEVAYAASGRGDAHLRKKIRDDLSKLHETIDPAARQRRTKPWTGLVLIGADWDSRQLDVLAWAREFYGDARPELVHPENDEDREGAWWPFVDTIVMPRMLAKKHEVFAGRTATARSFPTWALWASGAQDPEALWRPLSVAKAFLAHHVRMLRTGFARRSEAWSDDETPVISGPAPTNEDQVPSESLCGRVVGMLVGPERPDFVFHAEDNPASTFLPLVRGQATGDDPTLVMPDVIESGAVRRRSSDLLIPIPGEPMLIRTVQRGMGHRAMATPTR
ncbi:MAG: hypothetical protein U0234_00675 [Sandaracinus sp.]